MLARIQQCDFAVEDHGMPVLNCDFEMEGSGIGLGYMVDIAFLMRFMAVFGAECLQQCVGKSCWITLKVEGVGGGPVIEIAPLHKGDGTTFNIEAWSRWIAAQPPGYRKSAHELLTGEKP
jgi:hypothetical protein